MILFCVPLPFHQKSPNNGRQKLSGVENNQRGLGEGFTTPIRAEFQRAGKTILIFPSFFHFFEIFMRVSGGGQGSSAQCPKVKNLHE